ncbi:MAG: TIGR03000 domain-containing protein [Gemmataceae bacterium]|nr:TIGR03000 domain-containing protein [Gemmataceae bacterium]
MNRIIFSLSLMLMIPFLAYSQGTPKEATINVLVPESPTRTTLTIDGQATKLTGSKRVFVTPPIEPGKTYAYKISVVIEPNNYTKIFRTREVTFKAGDEVTVDMTKEDKEKDKIEVRWVPTPDDIVDEMCKLAKVTKDDVVYDFGCGDCVMLVRAIKQFGAKKGVGLEIDEKIIKEKAEPYIKKAGLQDKIEVRKGDILDVKEKDCADATVVLLYIGDDLGARLGPVLQKALKPGSRVVSHRFTLGDWKPNKTIKVMGVDGDEYTLHLWIVPEKK